jgi:hypothetical protein
VLLVLVHNEHGTNEMGSSPSKIIQYLHKEKKRKKAAVRVYGVMADSVSLHHCRCNVQTPT